MPPLQLLLPPRPSQRYFFGDLKRGGDAIHLVDNLRLGVGRVGVPTPPPTRFPFGPLFGSPTNLIIINFIALIIFLQSVFSAGN